MPVPTLSAAGGDLGAIIRANRGGRNTSEQGNTDPGIQRLGLVRDTGGTSYYLYYNPVTGAVIWSASSPIDTGLQG